MAYQENGKEEDKLEFTPEGESLGYISLDQARVLAMEYARDNREPYGRRYRSQQLVWDVLEAADHGEYYTIRLSFRPAGRFQGTPGSEQFVIGKLGEIRIRQVLDSPSARSAPIALLSLGAILLAGVIVGALFASGVLETRQLPPIFVSAQPTSTPSPTPTNTPIAVVSAAIDVISSQAASEEEPQVTSEDVQRLVAQALADNPDNRSEVVDAVNQRIKETLAENEDLTPTSPPTPTHTPQPTQAPSPTPMPTATPRPTPTATPIPTPTPTPIPTPTRPPTSTPVPKPTATPPPPLGFLYEWSVKSRTSTSGIGTRPVGIQVAGDRAYILESLPPQVRVFNLNGRPRGSWGSWEWDRDTMRECERDLLYGGGYRSDGSFTPRLSDPFGCKPSNGVFQSPKDLAAGPTGLIYVADSRIFAFDTSGKLASWWGSPGSGPGKFLFKAGMAADRDGNVYVSDRGEHVVQKFNRTGGHLISWGEFGSGPGQLDGPGSLAPDGLGNVYVADTGNSRVQKFSSRGKFIEILGGPGQFRRPSGIAVGSDGTVYVIDSRLSNLQVFDPIGRLLDTIGSFGSTAGKFSQPTDVALDEAGNIYVLDSGNDRVQVFAPLSAP